MGLIEEEDRRAQGSGAASDGAGGVGHKPAKKRKIILAKRDKIDKINPALLNHFLTRILGHPEALVTDRSWITDFISPVLTHDQYEEEKVRIWKKISWLYSVDCGEEISLVKILAKIQRRQKRLGRL